MSKQLDARSIRVLEDALSAVVRDANAATKDLRAALNDGRAMMEQIVEERFTNAVQRNVDDALAIMYQKIADLTQEAAGRQMAIMDEAHRVIFQDLDRAEIAEIVQMARMLVGVRKRMREEMGGKDPIEFLAKMGDDALDLLVKRVNVGVTPIGGLKWETFDVNVKVRPE